MRSTSFLLLAILGTACGGAHGGGAEEPAADTAELLPVGGCDENLVDDRVKEVAPRSLPWTYLVVKEAAVQCEDRRVIVQLGPGANVLLLSVADDASGANAAEVGPALVRAAANELHQVDPNATLSSERDATLGESSLPGRCARVDLTSQGTAFVAHVCAAWKTTPEASHFVVVAVTDTEQNFAGIGMTVDELVGGLVDGLSLE